ncbi:MAG: T9SS type A sorting domain-containing protein [Paludibacteraceae bacterium]
MVPRAKLISSTSRVNLQLAPWSYQNISQLSKDETIPYFVLPAGNFDFGGLKVASGKPSVNGNWTPITFATPFDDVPVVFASQLLAGTSYATNVRIRNITKTGFEAKIQKESAVKLTIPTEIISYMAIMPGTGTVDGKKIIVGRTNDKAVSSVYASVNYGETVSNPLFLSQMQTCNDDTVTAGLRCTSIYDKYANVIKQREKSSGITVQAAEMVGWLVMNPADIPQGVNSLALPEINIYPNPAKDIIYISQNEIETNRNVKIYNAMGILVNDISIHGNKINISTLPSGYYFIMMDGYRATKFIKI